MTSQLAQNYQGIQVEELVPDAAMVKGISRSSLLTGRRRVRLQPQTGTGYGSAGSGANGQIVQFVLADSTSLLDLQSVVLSGNIQTNSSTYTVDDGPAIIRRITVSINGTTVDDTDLANRFANANVYAGADRAWYNGAGSFANYWTANPAMAPASASAATSATAYAVGDVSGCALLAGSRHAAGMSVAWPVALLSSLFRAKKYLPLMACGELVIQLVLAAPNEALFARDQASTAGTYSFTDVFLEADFIQPHYLYQEMLNRVTQLEGESGVVIPYDATISAQGQSVTGSGAQNIVTSLATNNLRKVMITFSPTPYLSDMRYPCVSCFPNMNLSEVQFRVGSLYFPSQTANSTGRIWWMTQSAFNGGNPMHHNNGVIDWNLFVKTTNPLNGANVGAVGNYIQRYGDSCVIAYSFDCLKGGEELDADGISVLGQAGSQIVSILNGNYTIGNITAVTPNVHLTRTRYLVLKNGALRVEGV